MKKALIVGVAGFVGSYLVRELMKDGSMKIHGTKLPSQQMFMENVQMHDLDILHKEEIVSLLFEIRPDYIFHLAAQSSVSVAWKNPDFTVDVNVKGAIYLMDAVRELFYKPRML